jgi:cell wall-associated NlpC family hydrolase
MAMYRKIISQGGAAMRIRVTIKSITAYVILLVIVAIIFHSLLVLNKENSPKSDVVTFAKQYLGVPYRYGGSTPAGFDCSGYMLFLFHQFGKELPRTADQQANVGRHVDIANLKPGNMVFFATDEPAISHTGLYIGDHMFIHASSSAKKIIISNLDEPYWQNSFREARQITP